MKNWKTVVLVAVLLTLLLTACGKKRSFGFFYPYFDVYTFDGYTCQKIDSVSGTDYFSEGERGIEVTQYILNDGTPVKLAGWYKFESGWYITELQRTYAIDGPYESSDACEAGVDAWR